MAENEVTPPVPAPIHEMVRRIAAAFDPERIILFGSHARGTAGPDSDADLLVVMEPRGSRRQQATAIDVALIGVPMPADVIVLRPKDLASAKATPGSVIEQALSEGVLLYERSRVA